jgi:hypothetical protein
VLLVEEVNVDVLDTVGAVHEMQPSALAKRRAKEAVTVNRSLGWVPLENASRSSSAHSAKVLQNGHGSMGRTGGREGSFNLIVAGNLGAHEGEVQRPAPTMVLNLACDGPISRPGRRSHQ